MRRKKPAKAAGLFYGTLFNDDTEVLRFSVRVPRAVDRAMTYEAGEGEINARMSRTPAEGDYLPSSLGLKSFTSVEKVLVVDSMFFCVAVCILDFRGDFVLFERGGKLGFRRRKILKRMSRLNN